MNERKRTGTPPPVGIEQASALAHPSRRRIAEVLAAHPDGLTVAGLSEAVGLHHNAVREHLRLLGGAGVVASERDRPNGRGRPTERYILIDDAAPRAAAHEELVRMLVELLQVAQVGEDVVRGYGRRRGAEQVPAAPSLRSAVLAALAGLGFAPHETTPAAAAAAGDLWLRLEYCPFREAVLAPGGERICALHHGVLEGMVAGGGATVTDFVPKDPRWAGCTARIAGLEPAPPETPAT